jgi:BirA family biotin operon repressor/biotin-[acetyl-CoA-carboxylase] ligase
MAERAPIDVGRARAAPGWSVNVVEETGSTNADLLASDGAPDRSVLVAEYQASGRGRLERAWNSPPRAGLTFSVLLRPEPSIATWGWLPLLAGVALRQAVREVSGVEAGLKWPNDLLAGERKLAGILAQTSGTSVVIGMGLNVSIEPDELPTEAATSLKLAGATRLDRTDLLLATLEALDALLAGWTQAAGDAEASGLAAAYRAACVTTGRVVSVTSIDGAVLTGNAVAIEPDGRLRLRVEGVEHIVGAGDVGHLRPA